MAQRKPNGLRKADAGRSDVEMVLGVPGGMLLKVRERAGWSRRRLGDLMKNDPPEIAVPSSRNTILNYEREIRPVKPNIVAAYRRAIGEALFDALLEQVREERRIAEERRREQVQAGTPYGASVRARRQDPAD